MAQDSYRSQPEPQVGNLYPEPPHSQGSLHPGSAYTYPSFSYSENERQRYREASPGQRSRMDSAQLQKTRQPVSEAVNTAVDKADASNALPPEVLSQITSQITSQVTANILQQLKATTLDSPLPTASAPVLFPNPPVNGVTSTSPVHSDNSPPLTHRNLYTPPSPQQTFDETALASPISPTRSLHSPRGWHSPDDGRGPILPGSPASQPDEARGDKPERPKGLTRISTEITTLEKVWGPLFEGNRATPRLGQFLRGLALHLVEDYEPKHSLIITPSKMQKYYEDTKLATEIYPWQMVFDNRTSSISRLFREVEAQHHLVQERLDTRPDIPGLTPTGFEKWTTLMLLAHPDQEFERLQKAVLDMPICNIDDRKERFPKEISRRLFPKLPDQNVRERLAKAMITHCDISPLNRTTSGPEPSSQQSQPTTASDRTDSIASTASSNPTVQPLPWPETAPPIAPAPASAPTANTERERQPYSVVPSEGAIEEDYDVITPQPIERERKPYSAQPGVSRYDDINRPPNPTESRNEPRSAAAPPPTASASSARLGRSASVASSSGKTSDVPRSQPIPVKTSQYGRQATQPNMEGAPMADHTPTGRHRANSVLNPHPSGRAMRHRSPSTNTNGADYRRADGDTSFAPGSHGAYSSSPAGDGVDDARRAREYERHYPSERPESTRSSMYEMPLRDRESRQRYQSSAGYGASSRGHFSDEDYYRSTGGRSHNGYDSQQYYQ